MFWIPFLLAVSAAVPVTVTTDQETTLTVDDGAQVHKLQPGIPLVLSLSPGEHQLSTVAVDPPWRKLILVSSAIPNNVVAIPLRSHLLRARIQETGYWKDDRTGWTWAASDNGSGVTVRQAKHYCSQLTLGGLRDWRLPSISELQTLFAPSAPPDDRGLRVFAPLKLSGWAWSATEGNEPAEHWALDFADGARASVAAGDAGLNRALCVR